jgi:hypothetical protein
MRITARCSVHNAVHSPECTVVSSVTVLVHKRAKEKAQADYLHRCCVAVGALWRVSQ